MYSTRAFWKKRPIGQVYRKGRNVTSRHVTDVMSQRKVTSQRPVIPMTTRLILILSDQGPFCGAIVAPFFGLCVTLPMEF